LEREGNFPLFFLGKVFLVSMDESLRLIHRMTPADPVDVLDFVQG